MTNMKLFQTAAQNYLDSQRPLIKQSSYETYSQWIGNHLVPYFGDMECQKITRQIIQNFIFDMTTHGRLDCNGGLSCRTIKGMVTILRSILGFAKECYFIDLDTSCFSKLSYPKTVQRQYPHVFSLEEQKMIQNYITDNLSYQSFGILFALQTGVRIGELCALQYGDIDLCKETVHITKTLQRVPYTREKKHCSKVIISSPKSDASIRLIPIASGLFRILGKLKYQSSKCYILTGTEKYTEPRGYYYQYQKLLQNACVNYANFHTIRHTFATRCIESGADCKTVSEILGHASVKTTLDLYMHPQLEQKRLCIEKMNELI